MLPNLSRFARQSFCKTPGIANATRKTELLNILIDKMSRATTEGKANLAVKSENSSMVRKIRSAQETVDDSGSDGDDHGSGRFESTPAEPVRKDMQKKATLKGDKEDFGKSRSGDVGRTVEKVRESPSSPNRKVAAQKANRDAAMEAQQTRGGSVEAPPERVNGRAAERGPGHAAERGSEHGAERGLDRSAERGPERAAERGPERAAERGHGRAAERGHEHVAERGPERGMERTAERGPERADRDLQRSLEQAAEREPAPTMDRGRSQDAFPFGKIAPYEKPRKAQNNEVGAKVTKSDHVPKQEAGRENIEEAAPRKEKTGNVRTEEKAVPTPIMRPKDLSGERGEQEVDIPDYVHHYRILVGRHIEKVRCIYSEEIRPVFSWLYDELPKINTLERYIACNRLPVDMKPACALLLAKAYGDLVLEWIQKQVPLHCKWKRQIFNEDEFDPRQELFDMIANYFASTALTYMKVSLSVNDDHPERTEAECNDFMLQILRCLSYMDKPDLLKTLECTVEDGNKGLPGSPGLLSQRLAGLKLDDLPTEENPNECNLRNNSFMDEPDENLPDFEIYYGKRETSLFRKVWHENAVLREFTMNPDDLLSDMSEEDFPSSEFLITKISDVLDVLVEMINFELYTTHDRTFLLNAFAVKGVATPEVIGIVCGRYEDEDLSTLELWEGIFARVYQTLYPEDGDGSESSEENVTVEDIGDAPDN